MYLQHNQLVGTIPPSWVNLQSLSAIYLHSNQFSGEIPPEIESWNITLDISNNYFLQPDESVKYPKNWVTNNAFQQSNHLTAKSARK